MTATFYFHVADGDLRAENAGDNVRIIVGNFGWTILLEDRLDCARWMKALADADALFMRRTWDVAVPPLPLDVSGDLDAIPANRIGGITAERCSDPPEESCSDAGCPVHGDDVLEIGGGDLEPLPPPPPLPQRKPAGPPARPWQAAMDAQLSPEALAGGKPLATLAPEPQEDEAQE